MLLVQSVEGFIEHAGDFLPRLDFPLRIVERPAIRRLLQAFSGQVTVVPIEHGHFAVVFGRGAPKWPGRLPPIGVVSRVQILAEEKLPRFQVKHDVADDVVFLGVKPRGKTRPDRVILGRKHRFHPRERRTALSQVCERPQALLVGLQ